MLEMAKSVLVIIEHRDSFIEFNYASYNIDGSLFMRFVNLINLKSLSVDVLKLIHHSPK